MMDDSGCDIIMATTLDGMAAHREAWLACRDASGLKTVNNHPALFEATARAMGADVRPMMLRIDHDGRPAGILIGRTSRRRPRQRLGYASINGPRLEVLDIVYGGLMVNPEKRSKVCGVVRAELEAMRSRGGLDLILFNHLPVELASELEPQACSSPSTVEGEDAGTRPGDVAHWRLEADDGLSDFVRQRQSKKHRGNLRRAGRKLEEMIGRPIELRRTNRVAELDRFLRNAREITQSSYQSSFNPFAGDEPAMAAVMRESGDRLDGLSCYELIADSTAIAYQAGLTIDGAYHLLATAYRPEFAAHSPGQLLLARVLDDLDARGLRAVDFGFGDAAYKRSYGSHCRYERCVRLHGRSARSRVDGACAEMIDRAVLTTRRVNGGRAAALAKGRWRRALRSKAA